MYISKKAYHIEKLANLCYNVGMEFKNDIAYGATRFSHTNRNRFVEREIHTFHELLYCIGGDVTVYTDGFYRSVKKGTLLLIPRGCYHLFQIHGDEPFERLWIGFSDKDLPPGVLVQGVQGVQLLESPSSTLCFLLRMLCDAADEGGALAAAKAYGTLIALLCSLSASAEAPQTDERMHGLLHACLDFIEAHLADKLTLPQIASALYVSPSTLSHLFKRRMGISLHQYITQKRLVLAHEQIGGGAAPTAVFSAYGYADYSSFYKAYVKMFGHSPHSAK